MKAGFFAAATLLQIAAAQPHRHAHAQVHEKRQDVYVTDVTYQTVTAASPSVVVYVNAAGDPVMTSTFAAQAAATQAVAAPAVEVPAVASAAAAAPAVASAAAVAAPVVSQAAAAVSSAAAPAASSKSSSSSSSSGSFGNAGGLSGTGIVYSAYNADGSCKSQSQVNTDFAQLGPKGYGLARIYGTDCNQVATVGSAVKQYGMKLMIGIFSIGDVATEAQNIISASNGDYSYIETISVGNELVNSNAASPSAVIAALNQARGIMNGAGYTGKMVTVDTFNAVIANPSLCEASDFAAVNAHPFFDSSIIPSGSGAWLVATKAAVAAACPGKEVIITETGFPWGGDCNGSMCPSYANQATAVSSIEGAFPNGGIIILSSYNDLWKQNNQWTFNAEQNWGLYGNCPSSQ